jgi:hypothetical protein
MYYPIYHHILFLSVFSRGCRGHGLLTGACYLQIAHDLIEFNYYIAAFVVEGDMQFLSFLHWREEEQAKRRRLGY